ncbi:MAG TPA: anti-sigma factor [Mycobacterium sp.]|nr:anti-sigma factor [Mycobacterium sp.]
MTEPIEFDLLTLATPYALHAVSADERGDIERQLGAATAAVTEAFYTEVRAVRETMAVVSASTAVEPPPGLRDRVLASVEAQTRRRLRLRTAGFAAAAALVVAVAFGAGLALRPVPSPPTAEQVLTASDVRAVSDAIPFGGTATVVYSREKNAAVLVMNNVNPPVAGTVYQMWLIKDQKPTSAGTMGSAAVSASTTAVIRNLGQASTLAFTVEPGSGSPQPTGQIFAALPLS